ncbi:hypothetical protein OSB04_014515 [Centaurea solstitialis]|uniref:FAF domain-containing protein n=1 Tax=Centaurea solstitialis TaxID=347529 RepID=A0AA38SX83_9ASTR|nr:hypothetical protein OSB04_014515 [Centaurea solstitialis]
MSTIVYSQASQPSMDSSHVIEATTMRLKLVSPKSCTPKTRFEGSSFLESLSSQKPIEDYDSNTSYLYNQSLKLSQKSLELCTESLGSESGSDTSEDDAMFSFPSSRLSVKRGRREHVESKKVSSRSFPPPLTTMSGSKPFQVRPHREGGRLIIEATETSLGTSCLQAERSHGRLRLTCWKKRGEGDCDGKRRENDTNDVEKSDEEIQQNVVVENFQRLRRCNEDENGDKNICCHWEPSSCWVATS